MFIFVMSNLKITAALDIKSWILQLMIPLSKDISNAETWDYAIKEKMKMITVIIFITTHCGPWSTVNR